MSDAATTSAGMRIIKLLVGRPPQTVEDLTRAAGVTRTAVTQQIRDLERDGLVKRIIERLPGRGRPRNRFYATQAALILLCAGKDNLLGQALWNAIQEVGGNQLVDRILDSVSREMAEHYQRQITAKNPAGRLRQMNKLLHDEGLLVEIIEKDGGLSLHRRSCPFVGMFEENRRVCYVDQKVLSLVIGKPVHKTACRLDGAPCCVFRIDATPD